MSLMSLKKHPARPVVGLLALLGICILAAASTAIGQAVVESASRTVIGGMGKTTALTVQSVGDGLSYVWSRIDGLPLAAPRITGVATRTLTIRNCAAGDAVAYRCTVTRTGVASDPVTTGAITLQLETLKPVLAGLALPPGYVGARYHHSLALQPGSAPATRYSVTGLPSGLLCDAATGVISGRPVTSGTFKVKVIASNPLGASVAETGGMSVYPLTDASIQGQFSGSFGDIGSITLTSSLAGSFSGRLNIVSRRYAAQSIPFTGRWLWQDDGRLRAVSKALSIAAGSTLGPDFPGPVEIVIEYSPTAERMVASIQDANAVDGSSLVQALLYQPGWNVRTHPATSYTGYYTAELVQEIVTAFQALAGGSGYAAFTVSAGGTFTFAGRLPDGTAFAIPGFLTAAAEGFFYGRLHGLRGYLDGLFTLTPGTPATYTGGVSGTIRWKRPGILWLHLQGSDIPGFIESPYGDDRTSSLVIAGSRYLRPSVPSASGPYVMDAPMDLPGTATLTVTISQGHLHVPISNSRPVLAANHVATFPDFTGNTDQLRLKTITFNPRTGIFVGKGLYDVRVGLGIETRAQAVYGIITRRDPSTSRGYAAGYFTNALRQSFYDVGHLQTYDMLFSGRVLIRAWGGVPEF